MHRYIIENKRNITNIKKKGLFLKIIRQLTHPNEKTLIKRTIIIGQ